VAPAFADAGAVVVAGAALVVGVAVQLAAGAAVTVTELEHEPVPPAPLTCIATVCVPAPRLAPECEIGFDGAPLLTPSTV